MPDNKAPFSKEDKF